jgi:hypothetical protein
MFHPILSTNDLPPVGASREHLTCDFKVKPANSRFEMAKDVAALANASGGTLLIGAAEAAGALSAYIPLSRADAAAAQRNYEEAVRDRCDPSPIVSVGSIVHGSGVLLAINVMPSVASPVGVKVKADTSDGFGGNAYVFPIRVTTQTIELLPGQLAMFMLPNVRRAVILLSRLKKNDTLTLQYKKAQHERVSFAKVTFEEVDVLANRVRFSTNGGTRDMPIDAIESIWEDNHGIIACVNGSFAKHDHYERWQFHSAS